MMTTCTTASKRYHSVFLLLLLLVVGTNAFAPQKTSSCLKTTATTTNGIGIGSSSSSTALQERRWNFNDGLRGPFGVKKNAEIWNGRVAQVAFTVTLLQELITGKGVIQGIQEGNPFNLAMAGIAVFSTVALTVFLTIKGNDKTDYDFE